MIIRTSTGFIYKVLHAICDASEKAHVAILYSRVLTPSGEFVTHLLSAKVKVVPV